MCTGEAGGSSPSWVTLRPHCRAAPLTAASPAGSVLSAAGPSAQTAATLHFALSRRTPKLQADQYLCELKWDGTRHIWTSTSTWSPHSGSTATAVGAASSSSATALPSVPSTALPQRASAATSTTTRTSAGSEGPQQRQSAQPAVSAPLPPAAGQPPLTGPLRSDPPGPTSAPPQQQGAAGGVPHPWLAQLLPPLVRVDARTASSAADHVFQLLVVVREPPPAGHDTEQPQPALPLAGREAEAESDGGASTGAAPAATLAPGAIGPPSASGPRRRQALALPSDMGTPPLASGAAPTDAQRQQQQQQQAPPLQQQQPMVQRTHVAVIPSGAAAAVGAYTLPPHAEQAGAAAAAAAAPLALRVLCDRRALPILAAQLAPSPAEPPPPRAAGAGASEREARVAAFAQQAADMAAAAAGAPPLHQRQHLATAGAAADLRAPCKTWSVSSSSACAPPGFADARGSALRRASAHVLDALHFGSPPPLSRLSPAVPLR